MLFSFVIGAAVAWHERERILVWLTMPFVRAWNGSTLGGKASLHFPAPQSLFIAYMKLAVIGGLIVSLPILLYQLWAFISPGLYNREKRYAVPFVVSSCGFCSCVRGLVRVAVFAFPVAFQYLLSFSGKVRTGHCHRRADGDGGRVHRIHLPDAPYSRSGPSPNCRCWVFFLSVAGIITHHHLIRFTRMFIVASRS